MNIEHDIPHDIPRDGISGTTREPLRARRASARVLPLLLCLLALPAQAEGEVRLVQSDPAGDAELERPPRTVRLWFEGDFEVQSAALVVRRAGDDSATLSVVGLHTMGENDLMAQVRGAMPDGEYTLQWTVADADGESHSGTIAFAVHRSSGSQKASTPEWEPPLDIGVLLYDGAEPLDVFGPVEMWMNAGPQLIRVHLIAEEKRPIALATTGYPAALAPKVEAQYSFEDAPDLDVLMVPGGVGTLREVENETVVGWITEQSKQTVLTTSVCTGSALLARAGVLEGERATGNKVFFDYIKSQGPDTEWVPEARWVETERTMTSSGVSAGIDMSLAVIARFFGVQGARMIAEMTEYEWQEDADRDPFTKNLNMGMSSIGRMEESAQHDQ